MEKQVFNPDQFERTMILLKQFGVAQREKDIKAAQLHNLAFQKLGTYAAEQIPDLAPIRNSGDVGKAIVELLSTIPGIETKGIVETASKSNSLAISDQAIRIDLRKGKESGVQMYLTFPSAFPIPDDEYFTFELDRSDGSTELGLKIKMDSGCFPRSGEIVISGVDKDSRLPKHSAKFGQDSVISEGSLDMGVTKGEELNIVKLITEITSPDNLDSPLNPNLAIQKSKTPQLPSQAG